MLRLPKANLSVAAEERGQQAEPAVSRTPIVVAQIIRYASDMSHWSYSDLRDAVRKKVHTDGDPIVDILRKTE